jgi:hypothetical protein
MEKPTTNFSVSRVLFLVKSMKGRTMNADTLWRIIIGSVCGVTIALCVFAYFTYVWAVNTELSQEASKKDRDTFLLTDIKKVITLYQIKEETYKELLHTRPEAPPYAKGKGIVITPSPEIIQESVAVSASGTPPLPQTVKNPSIQ